MAYRKAGYSKNSLEGHREAITLHKAAKEAFEQLDLKSSPCQELNAEYAQLLEQKRAAYPAYRKARDGDAGVPCGAESGGCPSGKGEGTGGYGGAAQGGTAHRSAQMILAGLAYRKCRPALLLSRKHRGGRFRLHAGAKSACPCKGTTAFGNRTRSQPRLRAVHGFGYGPNETKWTSSGHAEVHS